MIYVFLVNIFPLGYAPSTPRAPNRRLFPAKKADDHRGTQMASRSPKARKTRAWLQAQKIMSTGTNDLKKTCKKNLKYMIFYNQNHFRFESDCKQKLLLHQLSGSLVKNQMDP